MTDEKFAKINILKKQWKKFSNQMLLLFNSSNNFKKNIEVNSYE